MIMCNSMNSLNHQLNDISEHSAKWLYVEYHWQPLKHAIYLIFFPIVQAAEYDI
jgi:hypothetical protein